MMDYTPEGIRNLQMQYALSQGDDLNKLLKKISRSLKIISLVTVITFVLKHKDDIKGLKKSKGE